MSLSLHQLPSTTRKPKLKIGRGYGSGKGGHTSTRGQKGQKSRGKVPQWFTGTSWVWFKRLPMIKGKSRFNSLKKPVINLSLSDLEVFPNNSLVNLESLVKHHLITEKQAKRYRFKLLNRGKLTKKLKVDLPASQSAIQAITKLGGEYLRETK